MSTTIRPGRVIEIGQVLRLLQGVLRTRTNAIDHGELAGLSDDDHPQYLTQTEADALYAPIGGAGITELTGDVTAGPGTGSQVATIGNDKVTYAKMQNVTAASRLLGRGSAAGAGDPEEISLGTNISMSGTTLNVSGGGGGASSALAGADFVYFMGSMGA